MANSYFKFKQFTIKQDRCAMKVTTDACLFGAVIARKFERNEHPIISALDIGTGTGLLSLMIAQKDPLVHIEALELEREAAVQASENIGGSPWPGRIKVIQDNILDFEPGKKYDLIFSNPPFYENELQSPDPLRNLAHHNADLSLSNLLGKISQLMTGKAVCWLLLPYKRKEEIRTLLARNELKMIRLFLIRNSEKHDYSRMILSVAKVDFEETEIPLEEINIYQEQNIYTTEFTALLKDYYLKL